VSQKKYGDGEGIKVVCTGEFIDKFKTVRIIIILDEFLSIMILYYLYKNSLNNIVFLSHPKFLSLNIQDEIFKIYANKRFE